jgi:hypothetical protein
MRIDHLAIRRTCEQMGLNADQFLMVYEAHGELEAARAERAEWAERVRAVPLGGTDGADGADGEDGQPGPAGG